MSGVGVVVAVLLAVLFVTSWLKKRTKRKLPPGPWSLPIIGSPAVRHLTSEEGRRQLYKKYGKLVCIPVLGNTIVLVADYKLLKHLFNRVVCCDRRVSTPLLRHSLFCMSYSQFSLLRPHITSALMNSGSEPLLCDELLADMVDAMKECERSNNCQMDLIQFIRLASVNFVWNNIAGENFASDIIELEDFGNNLKLFNNNMPGYLKYYRIDNIMRWISIEYRVSRENIFHSLQKINSMLEARVKNHVTNPVSSTLLDTLLELEEKDSSITREHTVTIMRDFLIGSFESIGNTFMALLHFLVTHQHYQSRLHGELDAVIGDENGGITGRALPFCRAFLDEIHRVASVSPLASPHSCSGDVPVDGYTIPAGAIILSDIHAVHHDEKYWKDPQVFRPERFLSSSGMYQRCERVIPFGIGLLQCIGIRLAKKFLLNAFVKILENFEFFADGEEVLYEGVYDGFVRNPELRSFGWKSRS